MKRLGYVNEGLTEEGKRRYTEAVQLKVCPYHWAPLPSKRGTSLSETMLDSSPSMTSTGRSLPSSLNRHTLPSSMPSMDAEDSVSDTELRRYSLEGGMAVSGYGILESTTLFSL